MRLCLVGMSSVGKSFWAKRLAARGFVRHDCDAAIAARLSSLVVPSEGEEPVHALGRWMGMPWSEGYAQREARYLELEEEVTREALERALRDDGEHVIDTTGSVVYLSDTLRAELRAAARVVYLRTPKERRDAMLRRYLEEPKPVVWAGAFDARGGDPRSALARCYEELLTIRDGLYLAMADVVLDAGELETHDPGVDGFLARIGAP